jgi:hypothetical protein
MASTQITRSASKIITPLALSGSTGQFAGELLLGGGCVIAVLDFHNTGIFLQGLGFRHITNIFLLDSRLNLSRASE